MKIAGLITGILLMVLSVIVFLICLMLPSMTRNKVNFEESLVGLIPAAIFFMIGFICTLIAAIFMFKRKKEPSAESA